MLQERVAQQVCIEMASKGHLRVMQIMIKRCGIFDRERKHMKYNNQADEIHVGN